MSKLFNVNWLMENVEADCPLSAAISARKKQEPGTFSLSFMVNEVGSDNVEKVNLFQHGYSDDMPVFTKRGSTKFDHDLYNEAMSIIQSLNQTPVLVRTSIIWQGDSPGYYPAMVLPHARLDTRTEIAAQCLQRFTSGEIAVVNSIVRSYYSVAIIGSLEDKSRIEIVV